MDQVGLAVPLAFVGYSGGEKPRSLSGSSGSINKGALRKPITTASVWAAALRRVTILWMRRAITLIGMPGAGKSTVGVVLAKRLVRPFMDTDIAIQDAVGDSLQKILDRDGYQALRDTEERILLGLDYRDHVIATGGSAVYSNAAMTLLKRISTIVYLELSIDDVVERIGDFSKRGIAKPPHQSIEETFLERQRLYEQWADLTIDATQTVDKEADDICRALMA